MYQFILFIHVFIAVGIIALVLVQQGKGASIGAAFGSGASQTVFGSRGSGSFLFRVTISLIAIFFITSIGLNYIAMHAYKKGSVVTLPIPLRQAPAKSMTLPAENPGSAIPLPQSTTLDSAASPSALPALPGEIPVRK